METETKKTRSLEQIDILPQTAKWIAFSTLVGALAGSAVAIFVILLDRVTDFRESHKWIIAFLPLAGAVMGWFYHRHGKSIEQGNDLIIDEIHDPKVAIPLRMAPVILVATLVTHLFGGSAGREGTAVQMGGSLADQLTRPLRLPPARRRYLLMAGMSAGFAAVFGTPLAGAIFGLEVLCVGRMSYEAILPCFVAAIVGQKMMVLWGIHQPQMPLTDIPAPSLQNLVLAMLAGAVFGMAGGAFAGCTHWIQKVSKARIPSYWLRPLTAGVLVASAVFLLGTTRYIGLGIPTIDESFKAPVYPWDFAAKLLFTSVTLGMGFKGGEVTPLFFIGSTLGNALSRVIALPLPLLTGMGFVSVFAGAANVPLACTFMGMELFGSGPALYIAVACVTSYIFSGHAGIYHSQKIEARKHLA